VRNSNIKVDFSALFEFATEGIIVTNDKGLIVLANPAAERLFQYKEGELLGLPVETLIPKRYQGKHSSHREHFNQSPHPRRMGIGLDLYGLKKSGEEFPVEVSLSPFHTEEGEFVIAFIVDYTVRKRHEDAILQQKRDLEDLAKALKTSNEELENFAYVSSHDLQEPLRKIRSFSDMLLNNDAEQLSAEGKDYLARIQNAASRMQTLIQDLLTFSRLTSRAKGFETVDLNTVVHEVLSDLEVAIKMSNAKIHIGALPSIQAEPTQMRQMFQNLISNALKFRKEDTAPEIAIQQKTPAAGPEFVEISVKDNGIGFNEKYHDKIFTIFQRLEGKKYEGTGIGLAICRKIAIRHGGNITASSQPGEGAEFVFTLAKSPKIIDPF
jgi:two-component system sensor kinase FixL